jgi:Gram-negative bacterial TonB protein C-terminal
LLPSENVPWPPLQDGVLEGNVTADIVVDREGKVRELGSVVSENSAIDEAGRQRILAMRFTPFSVNGVPVQAMSQITVPFKTVRPAGTEKFESARTYFEQGRKVSSPEDGSAKPYILRAEFETGTKSGPAKGRYEDTWVSGTQWRREAWFEKSHYIRTRNGENLYQLAEGPEVGILQMVLKIIEPIPAIHTFYESDWRIRRDTVNGTQTIRVMAGYESPDGKFDSEQTRGYWFDDTGLLLKTYFGGVEAQRSDFHQFAGVRFAHHIDVRKDGHLAMIVQVTEVQDAGTPPASLFELKGHPKQRAFTSEVR